MDIGQVRRAGLARTAAHMRAGRRQFRHGHRRVGGGHWQLVPQVWCGQIGDRRVGRRSGTGTGRLARPSGLPYFQACLILVSPPRQRRRELQVRARLQKL